MRLCLKHILVRYDLFHGRVPEAFLKAGHQGTYHEEQIFFVSTLLLFVHS